MADREKKSGNTVKTGMMTLAVALIAAIGFCEDRGATAPEFIWRDVKGVRWCLRGNAKIVGDELVCVADEANRNAFAVGYCDLSEYDGKPLQLQIVSSTENVTRSRKSYLGYRFMLSYLDLDMGGNRVWPNGGTLTGTQQPTEVAWRDINGKRRGKCEIQIGLLDCTGKAVYNLKTLQARATSPLVPKINEDFKVKYPDRVKNAPRGRGVMLGGMNDEAWDLLQSWGVNLVRHQIGLRGTGPATNHAAYVAGYLKNFDACLDELETRLVAARKRGIRVCIDQHSSPGGRCDAGDPAEWRGDFRMFHDPIYAQLFIDCWVKLAKRMAPYRDAIYGYDLINEACHNAPALPDGDIVNLQRRCAEAVRAVDPDTTIILESMYCDPGWFSRMSAIRMDNVIYQVHLYYPHDYTHQGILNPVDHVEFWPDPKKGWNREFLRRSLKPVVDFQKQHDAKMFVGEFSVIAWAPNAEEYMRDCMTIFEELGWDWTFHAFREFQGWSVEWESVSRGIGGEHFRKSASNPRMRTLKEGLKGGFAPGKPGVAYKSRAFRRVMISGNSITRHPPSAKIGWTNDWGMAASCPEKDYVHLFLRGLECHGGEKPEYRQIRMPLENGTANTAMLDKLCAKCVSWKPDLVVFAHGENARALTNDVNWIVCKTSYRRATRAFMAAGATVVLRTPYWPNGRYAKMLKEVADETGAIYVDIGDLGQKKGMSATGLFKNEGVAMHPCDSGMIAIADRLVTAVYERQMAVSAARRVPVTITFDDSARDHYTVAAPLLEKYGYRGIFNIITDNIGNGASMTWEQVADLQRRGHAIASHTCSHPNLAALLKKGETNEVRRQIAASRDIIEKKTGVRPRFLCPGFNICNPAIERIVREEGMEILSCGRPNFGGGQSDRSVGAWMDDWVRRENPLGVALMLHGIVEGGGGWNPFPDKTGEKFETFLRELKARDGITIDVLPYEEWLKCPDLMLKP